ncbi:MAG: hypothetical protein A4E35_01535 [Methanoregula sp. PtaU1.Bin051]|nr:MAG: hypothetical protein A4E35_01535 [Methanoregula sp. PtaU1.Bin051]
MLFDGRNFKGNNYFTTKGIVRREINNVKLKRLVNASSGIIRLFCLRADTVLERITDISFPNHPKYRQLTDTLEAFLLSIRKDDDEKQHDAILLSNSHIWAVTNPALNSPYFLTSDKKDIFDHHPEITQRVTSCLASSCPLKIDYLPYFIQRGIAS